MKFAAYILFLLSTGLFASEEMTLHDFMEEYTKPATKALDRKKEPKFVSQILKEVPAMAPPEMKEKWEEIIAKAEKTGEWKATCKSCHSIHKKEYKKLYRKRLITVPDSLEGLPKEIKKALK